MAKIVGKGQGDRIIYMRIERKHNLADWSELRGRGKSVCFIFLGVEVIGKMRPRSMRRGDEGGGGMRDRAGKILELVKSEMSTATAAQPPQGRVKGCPPEREA